MWIALLSCDNFLVFYNRLLADKVLKNTVPKHEFNGRNSLGGFSLLPVTFSGDQAHNITDMWL